jgi:hypothetical protein
VFDGIKMGANVSVNGHFLFTAVDQFLRYTIPLPNSVLAAGNNTLAVHFSNSIDVGACAMCVCVFACVRVRLRMCVCVCANQSAYICLNSRSMAASWLAPAAGMFVFLVLGGGFFVGFLLFPSPPSCVLIFSSG